MTTAIWTTLALIGAVVGWITLHPVYEAMYGPVNEPYLGRLSGETVQRF